VHRRFARVRVFNPFAANRLFSVATVTLMAATGAQTLPVQAVPMALLMKLESPAIASTKMAYPLGVVGPRRTPIALRVAASPRKPHAYSSLAMLPASGVMAPFRLTQPRDEKLPALAFSLRQDRSDQLAFAAFVKPRPEPAAPTLARLQQMKPEAVWKHVRRRMPTTVSQALAYAPPESGIEAPFDAVIGSAPSDALANEGVYLPRPRPDPEPLLAWLEGRALGQFAPGQHAWVQNPLPDSVHEAKEQKCLAEAIYFEARSEPEAGQAAVAQVVLNRVRNPAYPGTICDVVYQNKSWRGRCQFTFACDGITDRVRSKRAWRVAVRIAKDVTEAKIWLDEVGDSTHYHANYVSPRWGRTMIRQDKIGLHVFYRTRYGGWS
jgi:hypothetical protein